MRSLSLVLVVLPMALAAAPSAYAQEQGVVSSARLDFASEGEGCPDAGAFTDEVSARIGRVGFDDSSDQVAVVRIARTALEALVSAEFGGNTRVFRDPDCRVAAEAAAAAIAVWLDEPVERVGVLGVLTGDSIGVIDAALQTGEGGLGMRAAAPSDGRVLLRVTSNLTTREPDEDFTFHIETNTGRGSGGSAHYFERLCLMPCEARVAPGVHQFGVGQGTFPAFALNELTQINADSELHIEVTQASGVVRAGLTFAMFGFLGILVAGPVWAVGALNDKDGVRRGGMWSTVAAGVFLVGGILMVRFGERGGTEVTVRPL